MKRTTRGELPPDGKSVPVFVRTYHDTAPKSRRQKMLRVEYSLRRLSRRPSRAHNKIDRNVKLHGEDATYLRLSRHTSGPPRLRIFLGSDHIWLVSCWFEHADLCKRCLEGARKRPRQTTSDCSVTHINCIQYEYIASVSDKIIAGRIPHAYKA